ncbi:MAG: Holliday junction branch migration protein RuvA [Phycisphaerae bacterium]|jgi:Holliday junction DNA helicase RuvA
MISRLTGKLESLEPSAAHIASADGSFAREVLIPAYVAPSLTPKIGQTVTLITMEYLEGQGQGTSFIPRLIGFQSARDRDFFDLFTTVKGIGNRKALRAMAIEPAQIARAIAERNAAALVKLPEIGKRLAETMIAELSGKVEAYLSERELQTLEVKAAAVFTTPRLGPVAEEAVTALVALGETRGEAERRVALAMERASRTGKAAATTSDELIAAVFAAGR